MSTIPDTEPSRAESSSSDLEERTTLRPGAVGLVGALMQAVGSIAPALAGLFTIQFIATYAGIAAPLAYVIAFVIVLMLGLVLAQFTRHITSAGTYYTFVSQSLGGRAGFLVAWVYLLFYISVIPVAGTFASTVISSTLKAQYSIDIKWWVLYAILIVTATTMAYRGIRLSIKILVALGIFEMATCALLGLWGFFDPGPGGVTLAPLNPANTNANGLFLGVVFAIFAFAGWDSAAPIAEESQEPRRTIPRAVVGSILLLAVFLLITSWGQLTGWGTDNVNSLVSSGELPGFVLAHRYWGGAWIFVLLAVCASILAAGVAVMNVASRVFFGMARTGTLPAPLAKVHPRFKTPSNAIWLQTGINIGVGLGAAAAIGVENVFGVGGLVITFAAIPVFIMAHIGVYRLFRHRYRSEFSALLHLVFPVISSIALLLVGYESLNPWPPYPVSLAPPIVAAWFLIGLIGLVVMLRRRGDRFLTNAGLAIADTPEPVEARAGSPTSVA